MDGGIGKHAALGTEAFAETHDAFAAKTRCMQPQVFIERCLVEKCVVDAQREFAMGRGRIQHIEDARFDESRQCKQFAHMDGQPGAVIIRNRRIDPQIDFIDHVSAKLAHVHTSVPSTVSAAPTDSSMK